MASSSATWPAGFCANTAAKPSARAATSAAPMIRVLMVRSSRGDDTVTERPPTQMSQGRRRAAAGSRHLARELYGRALAGLHADLPSLLDWLAVLRPARADLVGVGLPRLQGRG